MNSSATSFTRAVRGIGLLLVAAALSGSGCRSPDKPAPAGFASVFIANQSPGRIRAAAISVMESNGYQMIQSSGGTLMFEKEATRDEQTAYADLIGVHEGEKTIVRVRMGLEKMGAGSYLLDGKACVVTNPGEPVYERSYALFAFKNGAYQKLLNEVKITLQPSAATP
jgi:hypothetical protein